MNRFLLIIPLLIAYFSFSRDKTLLNENEFYTVQIFVTDDYSNNKTPSGYCAKVPIIIAENLLYSGDEVHLKKGIYKVSPVVRENYWVEGYESELILESDTLLSITLFVVD